MKLYNFKCPNCGATLTTDVKNHHARCEYCGNEFHISDETETSAGLDNQEDGKKTPTVLPERTSEEVSTAGLIYEYLKYLYEYKGMTGRERDEWYEEMLEE